MGNTTIQTQSFRTENTGQAQRYIIPFALLCSLFFLWAVANNLNDILLPQFQQAFTLTNFQAGLIQSAFYFGYFVIPVPAGILMKKMSYKAGIITGLFLYAFGAALFWPAAEVMTMAGTSQMLDIQRRDFSGEILQAAGLTRRLFPRLVEAGELIGALQPEAARLLGLPTGIPVISAGHDTQFALFGAGARQDEPVLSSGTWEILMVRSAQVDTPLLSHYAGSTCELDSQPDLYNPGMRIPLVCRF